MKELKIADENPQEARDFTYKATDVAKYHGVSHNAVLESREYAKGQREKKAKSKKPFIPNKLDRLYAYHMAVEASKEIQTLNGADAKKIIEDDAKYEIRRVG